MDSKINLLHLITGLGNGGAEKMVEDLAIRCDKTKFNVSVASLMNDKVERKKELEKHGIKVFVGYLQRTVKAPIKFIINLIKFIKENNIQIVHAHMFHGGAAATILKLFIPKLKIIFTSHSVNMGSKKRHFLLKISKWLRHTDIIFSKEMMADFYKKNPVIIPNGTPIKKINPTTKNDKFTYIAIGGLRSVKNHELLVDCAQHLVNKNIIDFEIWILGDGENKKALEEKIASKKMENHVKLLGFKKDVLSIAVKAHVYVMPSHWEGFPLALIEAGLCSLPVIAPPVGSIPSILADNCGYLAPHKNFATQMIEVKNNYTEALKLGENLKQKVTENYDIQTVVQLHEELYTQIASNK